MCGRKMKQFLCLFRLIALPLEVDGLQCNDYWGSFVFYGGLKLYIGVKFT